MYHFFRHVKELLLLLVEVDDVVQELRDVNGRVRCCCGRRLLVVVDVHGLLGCWAWLDVRNVDNVEVLLLTHLLLLLHTLLDRFRIW